MLEAVKVVTSAEMQRIEALAYTQGHSDAQFMEQAGQSIASLTKTFVEKNGLEKHATLLIGKGNNGGDTFAAGFHLLSYGFSIQAIMVYPLEMCSPLCRKQHDRFLEASGRIRLASQEEHLYIKPQGVILDGLVGTGFQGKAEAMLSAAISKANASCLPILAIDIPSGLNGNTGEVGSIAVKAAATFYLGLPKIGFFLRDGWNFVGKLLQADFGMPERFYQEARPEASLFTPSRSMLPPVIRSRHKYQTGYVLGFAGSKTMSGAALLASMGALKAGAGIVRLFHMPDMAPTLEPWEILKEPFEPKRFLEESQRAKSYFAGPGLGRTKEVKKQLEAVFAESSLPAVIDADALYFIAAEGMKIPQKAILTPHKEEMARLLKGSLPTLAACQEFADKEMTTVILKGGPTFIFHPETKPLIALQGDPGMAKAGTGDVLTGVIAALLAQKVEARQAAALGAALHGIAGEIAIESKTSYGLVASDLLETLPAAFKSFS